MNKEQQKKLIVEIMNDDQKDGLYNNMTAVEWLVEQMNNSKGSSISMNGTVQFIEKELNNLLNQAKEMEKQQIKNSYHSGTIDGFNFRNKSITSIAPDSEQYYNEQYGK